MTTIAELMRTQYNVHPVEVAGYGGVGRSVPIMALSEALEVAKVADRQIAELKMQVALARQPS